MAGEQGRVQEASLQKCAEESRYGVMRPAISDNNCCVSGHICIFIQTVTLLYSQDLGGDILKIGEFFAPPKQKS